MNPNLQLDGIPAEILAPASTDTTADREFTARLFTFGEFTRDWRNMAFAKGALADFNDQIPVAYAHKTGGFLGKPLIVGSVLEVWEDDEAAYGKMQLSKTDLADEVWQLIEDGALTKVSIGGRITRYEIDEDEDTVTVLAFDLMEISVVPVPAMKSAAIVQHDPAGELVTLAPTQEPTMEPDTPTTPEPAAVATAPEPAPAEPAVTAPASDVEARLATVEDMMRERLSSQQLPTITTKGRPAQFRNIGEVLGTIVEMDKNRDPDATEKMTAAREDGHVYFAPNGTRMVDVFAFETGDSDDATGDGGQVNDLLKILRDGRVFANAFPKGDLDTVPGKTVDAPTVTENALVDYQTEAGAVASNKQEWSEDSFPKVTLAGGQKVTVQARDWSRPSYMNEVTEDLFGAYGEKVNYESVNGLGTAGPPQKMTGVLVAQAARHDAIDAAIVAAIAAAKGAAYAGSKRWPTQAYAAGATWALIEAMVDSENRPLLATDGPWNAIGQLDGASPVGKIRGLMGYADDAIPSGLIIIPTFRDSKLWESKSAPAQVGLTYPDTLTIDVAVFGYSALALRRPNAFAVVENVGATT